MTSEQKESIEDPKKPEEKEPKAYKKRITLLCLNGKTWEAEFDGQITPRDIKRLRRTLTVEYARVSRRRSTLRLMKRQELHRKELASISNNEKDNPNGPRTDK